MSATSALFTPLKAGSVTLRNRIGMSALTRNRASATGTPTDLNVEYYRQRAAGNAGLIVSEGVLIGPQGRVSITSCWPLTLNKLQHRVAVRTWHLE